MRIKAHSSPTSLGPATVITLANARAAGPADVLQHLQAAMVLPDAGVIVQGRCPGEEIAAIAAQCSSNGAAWVAVHQPGLELMAKVVWPVELAGKLVEYQGEAAELCLACATPMSRNGIGYKGKQKWICPGCQKSQ
jgi:hypothetical protein